MQDSPRSQHLEPQGQSPQLRKPSQSYVDSYISRRGEGASSASPRLATTPAAGSARRAARIFYPLEEKCPLHYYPRLHVVNRNVMMVVRVLLMVRSLKA